MVKLVTVSHHAGYQLETRIVRGYNKSASNAITVGMVVFNKVSLAGTATKRDGTDGASSAWVPANEAAAADLECGVFGIAKTAAAVGVELQVYVEGQNIPAVQEVQSGVTSITGGAPLLVDPADDELVDRAAAVTTTGLAQPIRFKASYTQTLAASANNTVYVDASGICPFGYFTGS